jgi:hypothetical protein
MRKQTGRSIWLFIAVVGLAVAAGIGALLVEALRPAQRLPDGSTLALVAVTYGRRHQLIDADSWQRLLAPLLPPRLRPHPNRWTSIYTADHPKTLVLWTHQEQMTPAAHWDPDLWEKRVISSDEHGCRAETGLLTAAGAGLNWPPTEEYAAWALPAFPRRGRTVGVEIEERRRGEAEWTALARFVVSNPDPGPHPRWKPRALPITRAADDWSATLTALETGGRPRGAAAEEGWSRAGFRLAWKGRPTRAWQPAAVTLSDATGNRWTPTTGAVAPQGDEQQLPFRSLLWPDETAWKLEVRFEQKAGFSPDQLWTAPPLDLPARRKVNRVDAIVRRQGATLRLLALSGPAAAVWDGCGWSAALPILHTRLSSAKKGLRVSLARVTDDQGRDVPVSQTLYGGSGKYSFVLSPAPHAKQIVATLALHRPHFAEFVAGATASGTGR